jgi:dephospho-CoA kinase
MRPLRIGLTGPIGCGKSTVAQRLGSLGGRVIDADRLARLVTATGQPTLVPIRRRFGDAVFAADGSLDRGGLARLVFEDRAALADLEAIVHPAVRDRLLEELAEAEREAASFVVIEAIKLVEGGLAALCDAVWLVTCQTETQRARLLARGLTAADADRRMSAQGADLTARLRPAATLVVETDGTLAETHAAVDRALRRTRTGVRF